MVTLVVTIGKGSQDLYSQKLAEHLDVPKIYSDIYQKVAELFNISFFSPKAVKALRQDWQFVRMLNRSANTVHLPNQHLGRYGFSLPVPYIITVHDLIRYFDLKGYGTFIHRPNLRDSFYLSLDYRGVKKATRIIAVSQTTKDDLIKHLGIPQERISVVYEGVDHQLFKPTSRRFTNYPYLLFVGSEHPRKNFAGLLKAFSRLKGESRFKNLKLVKVGEAGGSEAEFRKHTLQVINELEISADVIFTDYVAEEELPVYYSNAECFILPSFYEGFGFPPLEAMACGCPVIVSNRSSLPEIAGEAAIQVEPNDIEGIATAIREVLTYQQLRKSLINKGFKRAATFTWEHTAEQTLQVYCEVMEDLPARVEEPKQTIFNRGPGCSIIKMELNSEHQICPKCGTSLEIYQGKKGN